MPWPLRTVRRISPPILLPGRRITCTLPATTRLALDLPPRPASLWSTCFRACRSACTLRPRRKRLSRAMRTLTTNSWVICSRTAAARRSSWPASMGIPGCRSARGRSREPCPGARSSAGSRATGWNVRMVTRRRMTMPLRLRRRVWATCVSRWRRSAMMAGRRPASRRCSRSGA